MNDLPFWHLAGTDLAIPVRFGGETSNLHRIILRFGTVGLDGTMYGNVLAEQGTECLVVRDVIVWDPVTHGFRISDPAALNELAEQLDATAALCGNIARSSSAVVNFGITLLSSMLVPRFFVIGGIGAIVMTFFIYYFVLFLLAHWLLWFVVIPGCLTGVVCQTVRDERISHLGRAMLDAIRTGLEMAP